MRDFVVFSKALLTNQLARFFPKYYVRMTRQSGRGEADGTPAETAAYFHKCVDDYRLQFNHSSVQFRKFLEDKEVLEYGPGDTLGVALILYALGARTIRCVDRFPLSAMSSRTIAVYQCILGLLDPIERARAMTAFAVAGDPSSGFDESKIRYSITPNGLSGALGTYDLVISRAVLEHVNDLEGTLKDVGRAMKRGGVSLHKVDLSSHGLDRFVPLDFLTWPDWAYRLMYSHKGLPNRWRVSHYEAAAIRAGLAYSKVNPTDTIDANAVAKIADSLSSSLADTPRDVLGWRGFWMTLEHSTS